VFDAPWPRAAPEASEIERAVLSGRKEKRLHRQQKFPRFDVVVEVEIGQTHGVDEARGIAPQDSHARRLNDVEPIHPRLRIYLRGRGIGAVEALVVRKSSARAGSDRQRPHNAFVHARINPNLERADHFARRKFYFLVIRASSVLPILCGYGFCLVKPVPAVTRVVRIVVLRTSVQMISQLEAVDVALRTTTCRWQT
jgi:hypothetical protein